MSTKNKITEIHKDYQFAVSQVIDNLKKLYQAFNLNIICERVKRGYTFNIKGQIRRVLMYCRSRIFQDIMYGVYEDFRIKKFEITPNGDESMKFEFIITI